ncbi:hypothetical protein FACS1894159_03090 [Bacteroidia bacterium]|nr:hypothetical protein FACS1894159_03090 [Bacteroidia bacterium]
MGCGNKSSDSFIKEKQEDIKTLKTSSDSVGAFVQGFKLTNDNMNKVRQVRDTLL